jgi:hypothetical protein
MRVRRGVDGPGQLLAHAAVLGDQIPERHVAREERLVLLERPLLAQHLVFELPRPLLGLGLLVEGLGDRLGPGTAHLRPPLGSDLKN